MAHYKAILTKQQRRILDLAASGLTNAEIADQLCVSEETIKQHFSLLYRRFGIPPRQQQMIARYLQGA